MKREFLKALGLEDAMIDKILDEHSKAIGAEKAKTDAAVSAKTDLETQIAQRDKDLTELKKAAEGNEKLQTQVSDLQEAAKTEKANYESRLMNAAIRTALKGKVHDEKIASGLIDASKIKLDGDGNVLEGLDAQVEQLQKDKAFLFVADS